MRRFYIEVDDDAFRAIADLGLANRRSTRDQAAVLLEGAAKRALRQAAPGEPRGSQDERQRQQAVPA